MGTNGPLARGESLWIVRATISFPEPVSPVISTEAELGAAISTMRMTSCIGFDAPTSSPSRPASRNCRLQHHQLARVARLAQCAIEQRPQHRPLQRLFDVPERSGFDRRHRALFASFARDDDGRNVQQLRPKLFEQVQPVHAGQLDVRDQRIRLIAGEFRQRLLRSAHAKHIKAPSLQQLFVAFARVVFVLDNQHPVLALERLHRARCASRLIPHVPQPLPSCIARLRSRSFAGHLDSNKPLRACQAHACRPRKNCVQPKCSVQSPPEKQNRRSLRAAPAHPRHRQIHRLSSAPDSRLAS